MLDIEIRAEDGKIRCKICRDNHGLNHVEEWIRRDSLRSHEKSAIHKKSLEHQATTNLQEDLDNLEDDNFVTARDIPLNNVDDCRAAPSHGPSQAEREMWDDFAPTDSTFEIERGPEENVKDARIEFERKVEGFGLWGGLETMPEDAMGCQQVEDAWDEAEHDDILTEILQNLGQSRKTCRFDS
jgi:hypothetical protein